MYLFRGILVRGMLCVDCGGLCIKCLISFEMLALKMAPKNKKNIINQTPSLVLIMWETKFMCTEIIHQWLTKELIHLEKKWLCIQSRAVYAFKLSKHKSPSVEVFKHHLLSQRVKAIALKCDRDWDHMYCLCVWKERIYTCMDKTRLFYF